MKVKFLQDRRYGRRMGGQPSDAGEVQSFEKGKIYDLSPDHAERWIRRGAAVEVSASDPVPPPSKKGKAQPEDHEPK
jgi:hypothetical protein